MFYCGDNGECDMANVRCDACGKHWRRCECYAPPSPEIEAAQKELLSSLPSNELVLSTTVTVGQVAGFALPLLRLSPDVIDTVQMLLDVNSLQSVLNVKGLGNLSIAKSAVHEFKVQRLVHAGLTVLRQSTESLQPVYRDVFGAVINGLCLRLQLSAVNSSSRRSFIADIKGASNIFCCHANRRMGRPHWPVYRSMECSLADTWRRLQVLRDDVNYWIFWHVVCVYDLTYPLTLQMASSSARANMAVYQRPDLHFTDRSRELQVIKYQCALGRCEHGIRARLAYR